VSTDDGKKTMTTCWKDDMVKLIIGTLGCVAIAGMVTAVLK